MAEGEKKRKIVAVLVDWTNEIAVGISSLIFLFIYLAHFHLYR
jgi:hypothetical protein